MTHSYVYDKTLSYQCHVIFICVTGPQYICDMTPSNVRRIFYKRDVTSSSSSKKNKRSTYTATHCNALQYTATDQTFALAATRKANEAFLITMQHTLQHTVTHIATHCNMLKHTATDKSCALAAWMRRQISHTSTRCNTHCNTLQYTITNCNEHCNKHCNTHCNTHYNTQCTKLQQTGPVHWRHRGVETRRMLQHTLHHTATHYATHCATQVATHCNTLQHTATH